MEGQRLVVELHPTLLEAIVRLPLLQPATLDVLVEGQRLVVELHPTLLEAFAPFFFPCCHEPFFEFYRIEYQLK